MNCDNWLDPKNSLIAAVTGLALIKSWGPSSSASAMLNLSLTALSTLINPTLNWFAVISPTDLTLLFPRWSISSTISWPSRIFTIPFITSMMSCLSKIWGFSFLSSNFNLLLNFILPTSDKSYLSSLKNRLLNSVSAESLVGGSPGLIILYISTNASNLLEVGSTLNVFDIYGPLSSSFI